MCLKADEFSTSSTLPVVAHDRAGSLNIWREGSMHFIMHCLPFLCLFLPEQANDGHCSNRFWACTKTNMVIDIDLAKKYIIYIYAHTTCGSHSTESPDHGRSRSTSRWSMSWKLLLELGSQSQTWRIRRFGGVHPNRVVEGALS